VEPAPAWVAQCAAPAAPLDEVALAEGLGRADLRQVYFDCSTSWIFPQGAGWYVLPFAAAHDPAGFAGQQLAGSALVFDQRQTFDYPPFSILLRQSPPDLTHLVTSGRAAPGDWLPAQAESQGALLNAPISFAQRGALDLIGYTFDRLSLFAGRNADVGDVFGASSRPAHAASLDPGTCAQ